MEINDEIYSLAMESARNLYDLVISETMKAEPWTLYAARYTTVINGYECNMNNVYYSMHDGRRVAFVGGFNSGDTMLTDRITDDLRESLCEAARTGEYDQHIRLMGVHLYRVNPPCD